MSVLPNVVAGNADDHDVDSGILTMLVSVHVRESDADVICKASGLFSTVPSKVEADVTADLAGLASAGEETAALESLLAMETALLSFTVSLVKLGLVKVGNGGAEEAMEAGGAEKGALSMVPFSPSTAWFSSMSGSSESKADITGGSDHHTA